MRKKLVAGLVVLNVALFGLSFNSVRAAADESSGWLNCCRLSTGGQVFCCVDCCYFFPNCGSNDDCTGE